MVKQTAEPDCLRFIRRTAGMGGGKLRMKSKQQTNERPSEVLQRDPC
jgi:hypothetical protein